MALLVIIYFITYQLMTTIGCETSPSTFFNCSSDQRCYNCTMQCNLGQSCSFACNDGNQGCADSIIQGNSASSLTDNGNACYNCQGTIIYAETVTGTVDWECATNSSCDGLELHCGSGTTCTLRCGADGCDSNTKIYAPSPSDYTCTGSSCNLVQIITTSEPTTKSPSSFPTAIPTTVPTLYPTTSIPSLAPTTTPITAIPTTMQPTAIPTTQRLTETVVDIKGEQTDLTISFDFDEDVTEDDIKSIIEGSLIAYSDVSIISTSINEGSVIVEISITDYNDINTDTIKNDIESGLEDKYDKDIDVTVKETDSSDEESKGFWQSIFDDTVVFVLCILAIGLLFIFSCLLIVYLKRRNKKKQYKENAVEIEMLHNEPMTGNKTQLKQKISTVDDDDNGEGSSKENSNEINKDISHEEETSEDNNDMYETNNETKGDIVGNIQMAMDVKSDDIKMHNKSNSEDMYQNNVQTTMGIDDNMPFQTAGDMNTNCDTESDEMYQEVVTQQGIITVNGDEDNYRVADTTEGDIDLENCNQQATKQDTHGNV